LFSLKGEVMSVQAIIGVQWGDEGKGKIVDILSEDKDVIARYAGGANAGHTVVVADQEYVLHLIPSGILRKGKICVIGNGVVLDPDAFLTEIEILGEKGIEVDGSLFISQKAHLIMPYHKQLDKASESGETIGVKIGTTGRGIGPAYSDKASRLGIRVADLLKPDYLKTRVEHAAEIKNTVLKQYYGQKPLDTAQIVEQYLGYAEKLKGFIADCGPLVRKAIQDGKKVLAEGAQGTMLDIDHGTYPFVTSSNASISGVCSGLGIPPKDISNILGIMKAYTTRVGEGPLPTELNDKVGKQLREHGGEFGATTGRPRRCGWLDGVVGRFSVAINGMDTIALTKLDVLDHFAELKICIGYRIDGVVHNEMPDDTDLVARAEPVYENHRGWMSKTAGMDKYDQLPDEAKRYVDRVEEVVGTSVSIISTGQARDSVIVR